MRDYLLRDRDILPLIGAVSFSTGDGLDTTQRYSYDYSRTAQGLVYRRRNTALTGSIQLVFNHRQCLDEGEDLMGYIAKLEDICGKKVTLYWNNETFGEFIVTQAQFSSQVDPLSIFPQMSVSLAIVEGYIHKETLFTLVGTMEKLE